MQRAIECLDKNQKRHSIIQEAGERLVRQLGKSSLMILVEKAQLKYNYGIQRTFH